MTDTHFKKACDSCEYYYWYYDFCKKWEIKVEPQSCCSMYLTKNK